MIISLDLDGVLADFSQSAFLIMQGILGPSLVGSPPPAYWNWADLGATLDDVNEMWRRIRLTPDWYFKLYPLPGLIDLRAALIRGAFVGHELIFTTSRGDTKGRSAREQSEAWIELFTGLRKPTVYVVPHQTSKPELLRTLEVDAHLDDYPPTVLGSKHFCISRLLRQKWNRHDEQSYSIPAVSSVRDFFREIGLDTQG